MIVAVTGIILILFVIGHLLGNLQILLGPEWINGYSEHLQDLGPILWAIRAFLIVVVVRTSITQSGSRSKAGAHDRSDTGAKTSSKPPLPRAAW
jgi:hypothetical protein